MGGTPEPQKVVEEDRGNEEQQGADFEPVATTPEVAQPTPEPTPAGLPKTGDAQEALLSVSFVLFVFGVVIVGLLLREGIRGIIKGGD